MKKSRKEKQRNEKQRKQTENKTKQNGRQTHLSIITLNINGVNTQIKRQGLATWTKKKKKSKAVYKKFIQFQGVFKIKHALTTQPSNSTFCTFNPENGKCMLI